MTEFLFLSVFCAFTCKASLSEDLHILKVNFEAGFGATRAALFVANGEDWHLVMERPNPDPLRLWEDSLVWFLRDQWIGDNLRLELFYESAPREGVSVSDREIQRRIFEYRRESEGTRADRLSNRLYDGEDPYAWRMLAYDAQHTGTYPFPLHPPLEFKWTFSGLRGHDFLMMQPCAAHGMLYVGDGEYNWILALDLKTGEVVWERELTSNVWCATLSPGDFILFVGTSIGWPPESMPTFFALDPITGEEKWSMWLHTIQDPPIIVDTFVYATTGQADSVFALTLKGNLVWKERLTQLSPVYWEGRVYGPREPFIWDPTDTLYTFYCRDAYTGDSLWARRLHSCGHQPSISNAMSFFFAGDTLFALDAENGERVWKRGMDGHPNVPLRGYGGNLYLSHGWWVGDTLFSRVRAFSRSNGDLLWDRYYPPEDADGGGSNDAIISQGGELWIPNKDFIYTLDAYTGDVLNSTPLPQTEQVYRSWGFPIAYKNCFIGAHRSFVYVYQADTSTPPPDDDTVFTFLTYQDVNTGGLVFLITLAQEEMISLKLFDSIGRLRVVVYEGPLKKGGNRIEWKPERLPQGVYISSLRGSSFQQARKLLYLKGGANCQFVW